MKLIIEIWENQLALQEYPQKYGTVIQSAGRTCMDDYIKAMHGWMHGKFDPSQFDPDVLQRIKSEYGDRVVTQSTPIIIIYSCDTYQTGTRVVIYCSINFVMH